RVKRGGDRWMTKRFSIPYKQEMIERLTGGRAGAGERSSSRARLASPSKRSPVAAASSQPARGAPRETAGEGVDDRRKDPGLAEATKLTGPQLPALLRREGLLLAELAQWRLALVDGTKA